MIISIVVSITRYFYLFPEVRELIRIYPFNNYTCGALIIENVNKIEKVVVLTIEDDGFVKQEFEGVHER